jgi:hypothetical protein
LPIFINGVEAHTIVRDQITSATERAALRAGATPNPTLRSDAVEVDAVVSTLGFPLVGGPAGPFPHPFPHFPCRPTYFLAITYHRKKKSTTLNYFGKAVLTVKPPKVQNVLSRFVCYGTEIKFEEKPIRLLPMTKMLTGYKICLAFISFQLLQI